MQEWLTLGLVALVSFAANTLSALAGGGAGLLQLPALLFLGLPFAEALVTHKIASTFLGVGATLRHLRGGSLEGRLALLLLASGLPGVVLGARLILHVPALAGEAALGLLTTGLALYSARRPGLGQAHEPRRRDATGLALGAMVVFLLGVLNGSLTSGSGLFVTLWLVRWFGLDYRRAVAHTLVLVGLAWNGTGAGTLWLATSPKWDWLAVLIAMSFAGGWVGTHWGLLKGNHFIKRSFETVTLATGLALIMRAAARAS
jgi:uncharacterized membrane protein YfcA